MPPPTRSIKGTGRDAKPVDITDGVYSNEKLAELRQKRAADYFDAVQSTKPMVSGSHDDAGVKPGVPAKARTSADSISS